MSFLLFEAASGYGLFEVRAAFAPLLLPSPGSYRGRAAELSYLRRGPVVALVLPWSRSCCWDLTASA